MQYIPFLKCISVLNGPLLKNLHWLLPVKSPELPSAVKVMCDLALSALSSLHSHNSHTGMLCTSLAQVLTILQESSALFHILSLTGGSSVSRSCPTLCDPMDCSPPGSSVCGILQARRLEWVAIPFYSRCSRNWTWVSGIAGRYFTVWATKEAPV